MSLLEPSMVARGEQVSDLCPHCSHRTSLQVEANIQVTPMWRSPQVVGHVQMWVPPLEAYQLLRAFRCTYCGKTTLVLLDHEAVEDVVGMNRPAVAAEIMWPLRAPRELPAEAPVEVRDIFKEASVCESAGALRGAAGLFRACVEEIVAEKGATGRNLQEKINDLQTRVPTLDADAIRDLHDARLTGNWSLHDGVIFSTEEVADVAALIEEAVEVIYVHPARRATMAAARTARRQGQAPP